MRGLVPDCYIVLGKPGDRMNCIDYATTLFAFTWPVDKARKARMLADQGFDFANYFGIYAWCPCTNTKLHDRETVTKPEGSCNV